MSTLTPSDEINEYFMRQAINQANLSIPVQLAYCVGAILVEFGVDSCYTTLAAGYSRELLGNTHAEECCLLKYNGSGQNLILYTTMEPCSRRLSGKKSCTDLIIESGIQTIIIGALEPTVFIENCEGVKLLTNSGRIVKIMNNMQQACLNMNQHLFKAE